MTEDHSGEGHKGEDDSLVVMEVCGWLCRADCRLIINAGERELSPMGLSQRGCMTKHLVE